MTNHIHLVALPKTEAALGFAMRDTHSVYAMYFNSRTQLSGHVWQGRFYSTPLDENHLWAAVRYVEINSVRAGMVERAEEYPWSSAAAHCGLRDAPVLSVDFPPAGVVEDWQAWLRDGPEESDAYDAIRKQTRTGRPCGSPKFLDQLEALLGRALRPKKPGRPRKDKGKGKNASSVLMLSMLSCRPFGLKKSALRSRRPVRQSAVVNNPLSNVNYERFMFPSLVRSDVIRSMTLRRCKSLTVVPVTGASPSASA